MAIEHADFEGVERLALVLDGDIVSTFDNKEKVKLGSCKKIEQIMIGEDLVIRFSGVKSGAACTIELRRASIHLLDEAERRIEDDHRIHYPRYRSGLLRQRPYIYHAQGKNCRNRNP